MNIIERSRTKNSAEPFSDTTLKSTWRPMMAYVYMFICLYDFVIADILRVILIANGILDPASIGTWVAQTVAQAGVFHFAMGAILGASAWTRGQEKIRRVETYGHDPFADPFFDSNSSYGRRPLTQQEILDDPSVIPPLTGN